MGFKEMLEVRKNLKAKKPNFLRQNAVNKLRVPNNYRKPRGCSSRMRISKAGYPPKVSPGYQSPRAVKGLNSEGSKPVVVGSVSDLAKLDKEKDVVVVSGKAGARKIIDLYSESQKLGLKVENFDEKKIEELKKVHADRKAARKKKLADKAAKEKAEEKKEKKKEEKIDANDEKKEEKKLQEKVVTGKKTAM